MSSLRQNFGSHKLIKYKNNRDSNNNKLPALYFLSKENKNKSTQLLLLSINERNFLIKNRKTILEQENIHKFTFMKINHIYLFIFH